MADDILISPPSANRQIRFPSQLIIHEEYSPQTLIHDIAIILVSYSFYETSTLNVIPISLEERINGERCRLAGWGATAEVENFLYLFFVN